MSRLKFEVQLNTSNAFVFFLPKYIERYFSRCYFDWLGWFLEGGLYR